MKKRFEEETQEANQAYLTTKTLKDIWDKLNAIEQVLQEMQLAR